MEVGRYGYYYPLHHPYRTPQYTITPRLTIAIILISTISADFGNVGVMRYKNAEA